MGNVCIVGRQRTFKWRIEGFSPLHDLQATRHPSRSFKFGGCSWNLKIHPKNIDKNSGKECIGLFLELKDASSLPSGVVIKTAFELCIYDQLRNYHRINEGECHFSHRVASWGFDNIILLETFKHLTSGFLVNDSCNVSVKFLKVRVLKVDCSGMFECLSIQGKPASHSFIWRIENFSKLPRVEASSKNFVAGDHKWNVKLYPDGKKKSNCLGIFLELDTIPTLPFKSELYVEFSLVLLDQINGKHKKFTAKSRFDEEAPMSGLDEFLSLDDLHDPSQEFLVENACIIEASVMVLGSSTRL